MLNWSFWRSEGFKLNNAHVSNLLITEKFPGSDFSWRLLYVKSRISSPEAVPKPLGRELSRFTLDNTK